jgi:lysophospholipase L1-like esterase
MKHIILLGDSIFDNAPYVNGGPDVIAHLQQRLPDNYNSTLLAIDGSVVRNVSAQLTRIPEDATHLFVSVGGNDALHKMEILQMPARSSTEVFDALSDIASAFEERYKKMLASILKLNKPTTLCTIYYPRYDEAFQQKIAVSALSTFNDVIIRQAFLAGFPLIDLRLLCNEVTDYANPIEPSVEGGYKIAKTIQKVADEHSFEGNRTTVYF